MMFVGIILLLFHIVCLYANENLGDLCILPNGSNGICKRLDECEGAREEILRGIHPPICGFQGLSPIQCCSQNGIKSQKFCDSITRRLKKRTIVFNGVDADITEFPHMAVLGYADDKNSITWGCGGSLISYKHVLTAAHCLSTKLGKLKYVGLGYLKLHTYTADASPFNFTILKTTKHPDFNPPSKYHDIGIIELDEDVLYSNLIKPACLYIGKSIGTQNLTATGWGRLEYMADAADHLQKVVLKAYPHKDCVNEYKSEALRKLNNGIVDDWQVCAWTEKGDTCQGDSGGPLQTKILRNGNTWTIVGLTSFGKACGISKSPGVYTRVSNYISWIESIVWPN